MNEIDDLAIRLMKKSDINQGAACSAKLVKAAINKMRLVEIRMIALEESLQDTLSLLSDLEGSAAIRILKKDILQMKELVEIRLNHIREAIKQGEDELGNA